MKTGLGGGGGGGGLGHPNNNKKLEILNTAKYKTQQL